MGRIAVVRRILSRRTRAAGANLVGGGVGPHNGGIMARFELRDRVVWITGASRGIGRACAAAFHRAGAKVAATARSAERLQTLVAELGGERVLACPGDVTREEDRAAALARIRERFGPVDVLVNNAGWASFTTVKNMPREHLTRMLELNFVAPVALIQAVLPDMLARRCGQIINISSVVGTQAIPRMTVYSATKAALNALSTGLRMELWGSGVDVLVVAPGSTATDFFEAAAVVDAQATRLSRSQYAPERVARAVVRSSRRRRPFVTLTAEGKAITVIRRVSQRLADAVMVRVAARAMPETPRRAGSDLDGRRPAASQQ